MAGAVWRLSAAPWSLPHWPLRRELARQLLNTADPATFAVVVADIGARNGAAFAAADLTRWSEMLDSRNGGGAR